MRARWSVLWDKSQAHLEELMKSEKPRQSLRPKDPRHILELNAHEVSYRLLAEFGVEISDVRFATQSGQAHLRRSGSYIQSGAGGLKTVRAPPLDQPVPGPAGLVPANWQTQLHE